MRGSEMENSGNQKKSNSLKTILIVFGILLAIYAIYTIFSGTTKNKAQDEKQEWGVTKSTYIYVSPDFDSDTKGELRVGDILSLPYGVTSPTCETISEPGLSATLCYLQANDSGIQGWILEKWIEKR